MKSRTKSTRENLTMDSKSRRISEEGSKCAAKGKREEGKREEGETRKYLLKTLGLLQSHLKLERPDKKATNAALSASVFEIVRANLAHPRAPRSALQDYTSQMAIAKENLAQEANRSTASLLNLSSVQVKRRSNSTLDEYFKDKFGSPAKDEETIERKLRVLKALKRSQEIVSKVGQNTTLAAQPNRNNSSFLQDVCERKTLIVEKMKGKKVR